MSIFYDLSNLFYLHNTLGLTRGIHPLAVRQVHCSAFRKHLGDTFMKTMKQNDELHVEDSCDVPFCEWPHVPRTTNGYCMIMQQMVSSAVGFICRGLKQKN